MANSTDFKGQSVPMWLLTERFGQDRGSSMPSPQEDGDLYLLSGNTVTPTDILSDGRATDLFGVQSAWTPRLHFGEERALLREPGAYQPYSYPIDASDDLTCTASDLQALSPMFLERAEAGKIGRDREFWHFDSRSSPVTTTDEIPSDQPYARLIYEALMQAPGRRMMLREIYEWFIHHTNKPQNSGSNGWQNSIRHNLSMNQAFENEKSEHGRGTTKRANSVWYLTVEAIANGVQSTTRYRKQTQAKAGPHSRKTRHKLGSRATRTARSTRSRSGQNGLEKLQDSLSGHDSSANAFETGDSPAESGYRVTFGPATPANVTGSIYVLPQFTNPEHLQRIKHEHVLFDDTHRLETFFFETAYDELSHFSHDPVSQSTFFA